MAIHRGDDRLAHAEGGKIDCRSAEAALVELGERRGSGAEIGPGAEGAPSAGEDDGADLVVLVAAAICLFEAAAMSAVKALRRSGRDRVTRAMPASISSRRSVWLTTA